MTIPAIFSTHGEPYFRAGEARVIARLLEGGPQVLATGGGAFMNADTRAAIRLKGISIWLKADLDVLLRRVKRRTDRPLLQGGDAADTLRRLMAERYPVYAEADVTIESRDVPHDAIVDEIFAASTPPARLGGAHRRRESAHDDAAARRRAHRGGGRARRAQLHDRDRSRAARLARRPHGDVAAGREGRDRHRRDGGAPSPRRHRGALTAAGIASARVVVPEGEGSKSMRAFEEVCDALIAARIERGDLVVALGGGVIGDLAGFAAAVLRRGLDFVQVPTTLLAQVNSSVGGKTAINSPPRQEPDRRLPPAAAGARRHRAARHAAAARSSAPATPRSRNTACSATPRSSPGSKRTGRTCSPAAPARDACDRGELPDEGGDRRARRARDRRAGAAQSRPHLRPCARGRDRLLRPAAARRRRRARHGARLPGLGAARPLGTADAERVVRHLAAMGLPTRLAQIPATCRTPTA